MALAIESGAHRKTVRIRPLKVVWCAQKECVDSDIESGVVRTERMCGFD